MKNEQIYTFAKHRTVAICLRGSDELLGSGALISRNGYVLTCAHLGITEPESVYVLTSDGERHDVVLVENYLAVEITLLRCEATDRAFDYFTLGIGILDIGRDVLVIGYPDAHYYRDAYFRLTSIASRTSILTRSKIVLSVWGMTQRDLIVEGMSGGPVVDAITRELVGIIYGYDKRLVEARYDLQHRLEGLEMQRRDDFFISTSEMFLGVPVLEKIAVINNRDDHMRLLERVIEVLDLLGFGSNLVDVDNDHEYGIHSRAAVGAFSFELLILVFPGADSLLDKNAFHQLVDRAAQLQARLSVHIEKICVVYEGKVVSGNNDLFREQGVEVIRSEDLFARLIDFTEYLENGREQWVNDRKLIADKYLDLRARKFVDGEWVPIASVEDYISDWIVNSNNKQLLVLGKYGSGKTTLLRHLFFKLATDYLDMSGQLAPILISLNKARNSTIKQLLTELIHEDLHVASVSMRVFSRLVDQGRLLLLFDGFDEMAQLDSQNPSHANLQQLSRFLNARSKSIITCRQEYFVGQDDIDKLLSYTEFDVLYNQGNFDLIVLDDLTLQQVEVYLSRTLPSDKFEKTYDVIREKANLMELVRRPVLLDIILYSLTNLSHVEEASLTSLYQNYVSLWLERNELLGRTDRSLLSKDDRLALMRSIAVEMNRQGVVTLDYDVLLRLIQSFFDQNLSKARFHMHDILTNSFLVRNDRDRHYEFSHRSFYEYFLATALVEDVNQLLKNPYWIKSAFGDRRLPFEVLHFVLDMQSTQETFWELIRQTKGKSFEETRFVGGNAVTALRLLGASFTGKDFDNTVLAGSDFSDIDLQASSFRYANLYDCGFSGSILDNVDMSYADATRADLKSGKSIYGLDRSTSGNLLALGSYNNEVTVLSLNDSHEPVSSISLAGHIDNLCCVAFTPDDNYVISSGQEFNIRVWDIRRAREIGRLRGHYGDVWRLKCFDDNFLISTSFDGQIIKWDISRMAPAASVKTEHEFWGMDVDRLLGFIAVGSLDGKIQIWDYHSLELKYELDPGLGQVRLLIFVPGRGIVLSGHSNGNLLEWSFLDDNVSVIKLGDSGIKAVAIDMEKELLATGGEDGTIGLWKHESYSEVAIIENAHQEAIGNLCFLGEGEFLASTGHDGTLAIWNLATRKLIYRFHEKFDGQQFSCKGLNIFGIQGLSKDRMKHLRGGGAVEIEMGT